MFDKCHFITGAGKSIVIVVPKELPGCDVVTISVTPSCITFATDYQTVARVPYDNQEIYQRLASHTQIGIIEYDGQGEMQPYLTQVAYVEVWKEAA